MSAEEGFPEERITLVARLRRLRCASLVLGIGNLAVILYGAYIVAIVVPGCPSGTKLPFLISWATAAARILCMLGTAKAQQATAKTIVGCQPATADVATIRHERRMRYKRWLWWTRIGTAVTILQFLGALYLMLIVATDFSSYKVSKECFIGQDATTRAWKQSLIVSFLVLVWLVVIIQCFTGSDILRWRSFYATHDSAWRAHYQEVFDHGIREALCCLGRMKYLSVLEEDEVYSVARLLGDLVAYRASGTGHLEFLAGLALLQRQRQPTNLCIEIGQAPEERIREATNFHPFAEAAYTGPLLDFGRNPVLFPCAWLYRQGVLTPWSRGRRPALEGDNWWRGHAAAFLRCINLPPEALRHGRVCQTRREAAYFVVVLHEVKSVVIAVRGTETPEDLLTDGLCRDCSLSMEDLDGLIKKDSDHLSSSVRERVFSSFPHFGHSGIVESARELFMQVDGPPAERDANGLLSSLLGPGCECYGYKVVIVGHSLGGSVATLLGLRLYRRYPNLHVYAYGPLPCLDKVVAEACEDFVTSIVYNDEFSARLSVNSILRLRAAAVAALADVSSANSAMLSKLARKVLQFNKCLENGESKNVCDTSSRLGTMKVKSDPIHKSRMRHTAIGNCQFDQGLHQEDALFDEEINNGIMSNAIDEDSSYNVLGSDGFGSNSELSGLGSTNDLLHEEVSSYLNDCASSMEISLGETTQMFLAGLIIHIVPEKRSTFSLWKSLKVSDKESLLKAFVADREAFKDIIVTPYMFLDHLPWRCQSALEKVLKTRKTAIQSNAGVFDEAV